MVKGYDIVAHPPLEESSSDILFGSEDTPGEGVASNSKINFLDHFLNFK
jgi:hypothetical protein